MLVLHTFVSRAVLVHIGGAESAERGISYSECTGSKRRKRAAISAQDRVYLCTKRPPEAQQSSRETSSDDLGLQSIAPGEDRILALLDALAASGRALMCLCD